MRIGIATVQVPFIKGGAEYLTLGLQSALRSAGHSVEIITIPFRFGLQHLQSNMSAWKQEDFNTFDSGRLDGVIALKFPAYYLSHPNKIVWLLHQHRAFYDLYDAGTNNSTEEVEKLRSVVHASDCSSLGAAQCVYTISQTVTKRLQLYNNIKSQPLYHPPPDHEKFSSGPIFPFIFAPSRLEALKRQDLLIKAMPFVDKPLFAVIAGAGGMMHELKMLAEHLQVSDRIRFVGEVSRESMLRYYRNCLTVFFAPFNEDLGYVTLEAMLAHKTVVTSNDSGGPTEFVRDEDTGFVVEPEPEAIASKINFLWSNRERSRDMGKSGYSRYISLDLTWEKAVSTLLGDMS